MHSKDEFKERMRAILQHCSSKSLHALIALLPAGQHMSPTAMRNSCRYNDRWIKQRQTFSNGSTIMTSKTGSPSPAFENTLDAIIGTMSPHDLLQKLVESGEFQYQGTMKLVASRFQ